VNWCAAECGAEWKSNAGASSKSARECEHNPLSFRAISARSWRPRSEARDRYRCDIP